MASWVRMVLRGWGEGESMFYWHEAWTNSRTLSTCRNTWLPLVSIFTCNVTHSLDQSWRDEVQSCVISHSHLNPVDSKNLHIQYFCLFVFLCCCLYICSWSINLHCMMKLWQNNSNKHIHTLYNVLTPRGCLDAVCKQVSHPLKSGWWE